MTLRIGSEKLEHIADGWWILPGVALGAVMWIPILRVGWQFVAG